MSQTISVLQSLGLEQPGVLLVLALAVPLVLLLPGRRLRMSSAGLRASVLVVRLLLFGLLVVALAGPSVSPPGRARAVAFAIDVSDSMSPDQQIWARSWVARAVAALPPGSQSHVVEFGERAQVGGTTALPPPGASTDLAAALRLAAALLPSDAAWQPRIVLLTDAWSTSGAPPLDALPNGVGVSYVAPPRLGSAPVAVVHALDVPPQARVGDRLDVGITLQAAEATDARLRLLIGGSTIADGPVHLEAGQTQLSLPAPLLLQGFVDVRVELTSTDASEPSALDAIVVSRPAGRLLVLEDQQGQAEALVGVLQGQGLQIDRKPAASVPPAASSLTVYDGVVLVNTPATSLTLDQQRTLQSFVQDMGHGLLVVGGDRTYAPGGYQSTILDDMSPVSAEPPIEPQQGSLALFLVIDRSGSMDILTGGGTGTGATKLAMAREAAIQAADLLQPDDTLGVIAFDSAFQWVVPPTKLRTPDDVKQADALISTIRPGGGTNILPPLEAAYKAAAQVDAPLRHIVLLTDGESNDRGYEDLINRTKADQITLSTLAIGSDADTRLLSSLARLGGGRYYFTERSAQIPRIASKETNILTRNAIVEGQVGALVSEPSPILRSLSGDFPPLSGYVATTRKDRAVTALETERGHPLLAHWQYGLGRVVAWTSDADQGWTSQWASWAGAAQFWSQAVRWSLPAPVAADFQPSVSLAPDGRHVSLQLRALRDDGHFADLQDTRVTVVSPSGEARQIAVPQTAPGAYELDTRVDAPGAYRVLFSQGTREELAGFVAPDSVEAHTAGVNRALLDELAGASGGRELRDVAELAQPANGPAAPIELWPWLLLGAIVLLPLDIYLRRRA